VTGPAAPLAAPCIALARVELIDALAALFEAQQAGVPAACVAPLLPGALLAGGARVPGTSLELDPPQAAWCIAWPCGNARVGALLALGDYLARRAVLAGSRPPLVAQLLQGLASARTLATNRDVPGATDVVLAGIAAQWLGGDETLVATTLALAATGPAPQDVAAAAFAALRAALLARAGVLPAGDARLALHDQPLAAPAAALDEAAVWRRFELAVAARFPARQVPRLLAAVGPNVDLAALPLQRFVAALVRAA
jgi:hypothetical protein